MRSLTRLVRLGIVAYGVTRVWSAVQELWLTMNARAREEADLIAARDLDAELVGQRADDRSLRASGGPSPTHDADRGPATPPIDGPGLASCTPSIRRGRLSARRMRPAAWGTASPRCRAGAPVPSKPAPSTGTRSAEPS